MDSHLKDICSDAPSSRNVSHLAACPGCDLLFETSPVDKGYHRICRRCGATVARARFNSVDRVLVFSMTGLLLYLPAILLPLMTLTSIGISVEGNVLETAVGFFAGGYPLVAIMVLMTAVVLPLVKLMLAFTSALAIRVGRQVPWSKSMLRLMCHLDEWGMLEVYLLGILVTLIKIHDMASVDYGYGLFCFTALVLLSIATSTNIDKDQFWDAIDQGRKRGASPDKNSPAQHTTAAGAGLLRCHDCGLLLPDADINGETNPSCLRCGATVHLRKTNSVTRTWALVITSLVLFIPANTLPIMQVDFLGVPDRSTIMDGIIYFFKEGSYGIGLIIFLASVLVPLFKITGLIIILLSIRYRRAKYLRQKAEMFRFIEFIGRWSMLDIFVIAILTALVDFGFLTSIHTAPGATFFCGVVVTTMMAAIVFDPRVMWDSCAASTTTAKKNNE